MVTVRDLKLATAPTGQIIHTKAYTLHRRGFGLTKLREMRELGVAA